MAQKIDPLAGRYYLATGSGEKGKIVGRIDAKHWYVEEVPGRMLDTPTVGRLIGLQELEGFDLFRDRVLWRTACKQWEVDHEDTEVRGEAPSEITESPMPVRMIQKFFKAAKEVKS